jgi:hypothetical protein
MPGIRVQKEQVHKLIQPAAVKEALNVRTMPGVAGRILSLQKSIGNQAVQRMLANSPENTVIPPTAPVFRQVAEEES